MKIEQINSYKYKITFSCTEILQMNSEIHPTQASTLIQSMINALEKEYQFSILNRKVLMEMIPSMTDGCHLYLTVISNVQSINHNPDDIMILSFQQKKAVADAIAILEQCFLKECVLYLLDEMYYLVISSIQKLHQNIQTRLSDLGECIKNPKMYEPVLLEYATFIARGKALRSFL